jgi:hypothetical protein
MELSPALRLRRLNTEEQNNLIILHLLPSEKSPRTLCSSPHGEV